MSNNKLIQKQEPLEEQKLSSAQRKLRKLKKDPKLFLVDSKAYVTTRKTLYLTWAKLGSFALVLLASMMVIGYYTLLASPRFASQTQFVVKQASDNEMPIPGLAAIGAASPSTRDALIIQEFVQSMEMAEALDKAVGLKAHYEDQAWDQFSRLKAGSTREEYLEYFQSRIRVEYNELSEILLVEVQAFTPEYALELANTLLSISEKFINQLGVNMANSQLQYAQREVDRSHEALKQQQVRLVEFQNTHKLISPDTQSGALLSAVHQLEAEIITQETELKSLQAYMRPDTAQVKALEYRIEALRQQLVQEKAKLTSSNQESLNKLAADFKEIELNTKLSADLYASALTSLEMARAEAVKKLKHLLIVEQPRLAQEDSYPKRQHSIVTWFVVLLLIYFVGRLTLAVIKEHRD
ncbi:lipopolysaccharide biosynthesis protein [Shewanella corallii]|uniref:Lipopolysaccharide biosynthesis protein n=1 Tax=Shewanella corallii TaxID=560080 RepID=A0ABT0N7L4_9GAMM|nr:lipopolysaccharide biosynthesis protein [Shewanella corallii]MCL2914150.1 lipopolysaccharide biosynthesis protein [Shewanella corallii]